MESFINPFRNLIGEGTARMRFHIGAPPTSADFTPDTTWRPLAEPAPCLLQVVALPVGLLVSGGVAWCWVQMLGTRLSFSSPTALFRFVLLLLLAFPLLIVVHELVHMALHPHMGGTRATIVGVWPSHMMFFAHYDGALSRTRFVAILAMPLLILTVVPLALWAVLHPAAAQVGWLLAWCGTWNALFACGDVVGMVLVLAQVPRSAIVRNQGWQTYWRA
jgi:hypothetical protein